jgi:hypothetical protein
MTRFWVLASAGGILQTPLPALLVEQALLLAQQLEQTADAAPSRPSPSPPPRERARQAVQATPRRRPRPPKQSRTGARGRPGCACGHARAAVSYGR